jgi:hypothetical protein
MSKFKKKAAKFFNIDLGETLEEQLKDFLKDSDTSFFEDPWDSVTSAANKSDQSNASLVSNGDEFYDSLMKLYISDLEYLTQDAKPRRYHAISGSGPAWFFEPDTRTLVKTERGMQVLVLAEEEDDLGRLLVQTMNTLIMVPKEEILDIGYN